MTRMLALLVALMAAPAFGQVGVYLQYSQWIKLEADMRIAYVAGAADSMNLFSKHAAHYYACLQREKLTMAQLAYMVAEISIAEPAMMERTVQEAMLGVLQRQCGRPPEQ